MNLLFKLNFSTRISFIDKILALFLPVLEKVLGLRACENIYQTSLRENDLLFPADKVLKTLNLQTLYSERELTNVPTKGALLIVANHPFGGVEGLALASVIAKVRPDVKVLANDLLYRIDFLRSIFIPVKIFGDGQQLSTTNAVVMKNALRHLQEEKTLIVFPAGVVSHFQLSKMRVVDPIWQNGSAWLLKHSKASALPIFIKGRNSFLFQIAGLFHPILRTILLPREFASRQDKNIHLRIGNKISGQQWSGFKDLNALSHFLRQRTYLLASDKKLIKTDSPFLFKPSYRKIISPVDPLLIQKEIDRLPAEQKYAEVAEREIWMAKAHEIPQVLREIGRLREITFRATGEGTGKSLDLDRFDYLYDHLFLWDKKNKNLVGSYRLGQVKQLLALPGGRQNLYTHTLFHFKKPLFRILGSSLELGRSFVREEYQKEYAPLLMLWKGIGTFVAKHPEYRYLFGAVSIDASYGTFSRALLIAYLKKWRFRKDLSQWLKARSPFRSQAPTEWNPETTVAPTMEVDELSGLISDVEGEDKRIPVLLKHYLKVGGKLLGFNVDEKFGHVLDGLILVDLLEAEAKTLERHLGAEGYETFMKYHNRFDGSKRKTVA